ncbi:helix-turn-helix domain-containing protein [Mesorhizobium sp. M0207]|uniref:helix-turn-helix domain-containing protein n=1 Tax=Mesorhizobium sp. M0207 TaxID=2956915 RepID=UPI003339DD02
MLPDRGLSEGHAAAAVQFISGAPPSSRSEGQGMPGVLIKPREAAAMLAISIRQLTDLTMAGEIPFVNVGRWSRVSRRYHPTDIEAFIEARKTRVTPYNKPFGSYAYKRSAEIDRDRREVEQTARAMATWNAAVAAREERARAKQAMHERAAERRRLYAEGVETRKAERLRKKAEQAKPVL